MYEAGELSPMNLENAPLMDTVQVAGGGYTVIRFKAHNPGKLSTPQQNKTWYNYTVIIFTS